MPFKDILKTNPNDNAYPLFANGQLRDGLTKLEAFTMAAMQGLCANPDLSKRNGEIGETAVGIAQATLRALNEVE